MSQSGPADAAPPGPLPARHGAGPALALRNWPVARRLIVLVAIPTMLGLALTGLRVYGAMRNAEAYGQVGRLAALGQQVTGLAQAMENERADTATFIAAGHPSSGLRGLHWRYAVTDGWAARTRRLVLQLGRGSPARPRASTATVLASIAELPGLRRQAARTRAPALVVIDGYSAAIAGLFPVNESIAELSGNSALTTSARALGWLSRMKDQASQQQAILGVALAEGRFGPGALAALTSAETQQASELAAFRSLATPEESWALTDTLARPPAAAARAIEQRAAAAGAGPLTLAARSGRQWSAGMSYTVGWMRDAEQQLAAWITAYAQAQQRGAMRAAMITAGTALALLILIVLVTLIIVRSLVRPLRRLEAAALDIAGVRLPAEVRALNVAGNPRPALPVTPIDVPSADQIGRVARAVDRMHQEAVLLAWEEARLQGSVNAIYASSFRRSHSLLERLLRLIDSLELGEDHPERLATLFQVDHLATRLRRNSDSTLILAGHDAPDRRAEPVTLVDVLRAAVSEIEQYNRVTVTAQEGVSVSGRAVADAVHLLAELLDNATTFSPQTTQVIMSGHRVRGDGSLITITDRGTGMPEEQLSQLNWQLGRPHLADVTDTPHLGLFAVAQLAARHGIKVTLGLSPDGGTTAEVRLPAALISRDAKPGGRPGAAGEALRAGANGGAATAAADPVRPAPRFPAGPELAMAPQIASPDAVPLPLGAPLPSPAPSAPLAATAAGPAGAEPGGTLPDFESVTPAGLPQRIPRADPVPGSAAGREPRQAAAGDPAQIAAGRLASFQRGSRRARAATRTERDAKQPSRDA
ncbi:MAG TPA: nitrate- and nitrite sensing domain-containing protein [Streptosporangiaceae bacterium]|nr:nitrate- and nitrite sensing domain-containing protein [Streptosporangiaceae bacterium]